MTVKALARNIVPTAIWTQLRRFRIRWDVSTFKVRRVRHNYGGFPLEISLEDGLGAGWYDHDWPELPEISLLRKHKLRPGARVFDLGAHQGVVALMLARLVGSEGAVIGVEACPHNAQVAERNRALNAAGSMRVLHAAVAATSGTLIFGESLNGQVDDGKGLWGRIEVRALTIDELTREFGLPAVLFIDVEGFECEALRGAPETLAQGPDCYVEVHGGLGLETFGGSIDTVLSYFPTDRYELFFGTEGSGEFEPLGDTSALLGKRFFLVAVHKSN